MSLSLVLPALAVTVSFCGLVIAITVHLIRFTTLFTSMQKDLDTIRGMIVGLRSTVSRERTEWDAWKRQIELVIYKPSWKRTYPPEEK